MKDLQPAGINDDMPLDENSWIHGNDWMNGFTGV